MSQVRLDNKMAALLMEALFIPLSLLVTIEVLECFCFAVLYWPLTIQIASGSCGVGRYSNGQWPCRSTVGVFFSRLLSTARFPFRFSWGTQ